MIQIEVLASSSKGNCYHVTDGKTSLLLECGLPIKQIRQKLNYQLSDVSGCLITHEHSDHSKAVRDIKAGMNCFMSQGTKDALNVSGHRIHVIKAGTRFKIGTWDILPLKTWHDSAEPLAFYMISPKGRLVFITDTAKFPYQLPGLTHIMVESNYSLELLEQNELLPAETKSRIVNTHMSLEDTKKFLLSNDMSQVRGIWLLHLSDDNSDAAMFKRSIQEITGLPVYV